MEDVSKINILGLDFHVQKRVSLQETIKELLKANGQSYIVTPNPEIILLAQEDEMLHNIINNANLSIPDGIGVKFASWLQGVNAHRWAGSEITRWLLKEAEFSGTRIAIFNLKGGLSSGEDISIALKKEYPNLNFAIENIDRQWSLAYYQNINVFRPEIIFVALGSPYQEKFIRQNLTKMPYVKLAIGVGGSFDYISGKIKSAPLFLKILGLEWLWRLVNISGFKSKKAERAKRIFRAVFVFPCYYLKWLLVSPFLYRKNVACLVYRKVDNKNYFLIVKRSYEDNHWQIVQGGLDGQNVVSAGLRELKEELGTNKFKIIKTFHNIYKYKFPEDFRNNKYGRNYKGQKQSLLIAEFIGKDNEISLNDWEHCQWRWVLEDELTDSVFSARKEMMEKSLVLFKKIN